MVDNDLQRSSLNRLNGLNAMVGNFAATSTCHYLDSVHECHLYNVKIICSVEYCKHKSIADFRTFYSKVGTGIFVS